MDQYGRDGARRAGRGRPSPLGGSLDAARLVGRLIGRLVGFGLGFGGPRPRLGLGSAADSASARRRSPPLGLGAPASASASAGFWLGRGRLFAASAAGGSSAVAAAAPPPRLLIGRGLGLGCGSVAASAAALGLDRRRRLSRALVGPELIEQAGLGKRGRHGVVDALLGLRRRVLGPVVAVPPVAAGDRGASSRSLARGAGVAATSVISYDGWQGVIGLQLLQAEAQPRSESRLMILSLSCWPSWTTSPG